jgi:hypothetical protein
MDPEAFVGNKAIRKMRQGEEYRIEKPAAHKAFLI